jgi:hypothetical protein
MTYAYIQDVPISAEVYRKVMERIGPEPMVGQLDDSDDAVGASAALCIGRLEQLPRRGQRRSSPARSARALRWLAWATSPRGSEG